MSTTEHETIAAALAAAQGEFGEVKRSRTVTVKTDKGDYEFAYAPLDVVFAAVRAPLAKHGLALTQLIDGEEGNFQLTTQLIHRTGTIQSVVKLPQPSRPGPQAFGSVVTYLRRYTVQAMLGIAAEEDDDANAAEGNHVEQRQRAPAARAQAPAPSKTQAPPADPNAIGRDEFRLIRAALRELGWDEARGQEWLKENHGKDKFASLTRPEFAKVQAGLEEAIKATHAEKKE